MPVSSLYLGLMSGTSLDGVDAVVVDFGHKEPRLLASSLLPFDAKLKDELMALQQAGPDELHRSALAANELAETYAGAVADVLGKARLAPGAIAAIGMHGQTIRHRPELGYTLQIGNAARLAELAGITVIADFRSRDVAAGGQGAPLVPAFHQFLFGGDVHRAVVNIGGIANLTDLPLTGPVRGWDTGPGNVLMDLWINRQQGRAYDESGRWAASGRIIEPLLNQLQQESFFQRTPPKSTGRDLFHTDWLAQFALAAHAPQDIQATLLELTAWSIARAVETESPQAEEVYVCGGGARNGALMARLASLLAPRRVASTETLGLHPDWVEAVAFAWLAHACLMGRPGNLAAVTGARGPRILGAIYPA